MGGTNEAICQPPARSKTGTTLRAAAVSRLKLPPVNPIRYHEVTQRGQVDFHDDAAGTKCSVDSAAFFSSYHDWRAKNMEGDLTMSGDDGKGGHMAVKFLPYVDDAGNLQVGMTVSPATIGQSVTDLDKLASYP